MSPNYSVWLDIQLLERSWLTKKHFIWKLSLETIKAANVFVDVRILQ